MIKVTYDDNEYTYNNNSWYLGDSEDFAPTEVASKLSAIAVESGVSRDLFDVGTTSRTADVTAPKKRKSKNPKIKIFDN